jgi:hypothetical protein
MLELRLDRPYMPAALTAVIVVLGTVLAFL